MILLLEGSLNKLFFIDDWISSFSKMNFSFFLQQTLEKGIHNACRSLRERSEPQSWSCNIILKWREQDMWAAKSVLGRWYFPTTRRWSPPFFQETPVYTAIFPRNNGQFQLFGHVYGFRVPLGCHTWTNKVTLSLIFKDVIRIELSYKSLPTYWPLDLQNLTFPVCGEVWLRVTKMA